MSKRDARLVRKECKDAFYHEHRRVLVFSGDRELWFCADNCVFWIARWISATVDREGHTEYLDDLVSFTMTLGYNKPTDISIKYTPKTFKVGEPGYEDEHEIGNDKCQAGWCRTGGFPMKCKCGGLIHSQFGDDSEEGYWLWHKCDRCGDDWSVQRKSELH